MKLAFPDNISFSNRSHSMCEDDRSKCDSGDIKIDFSISEKQRVTFTLEDLKPRFKKVMGPEIATELINSYGSKLKDVSHAVVWKEFFLQSLQNFHPHVRVYFEKGFKGLTEIYYMGDPKEQELFDTLFNYFEQYICKLFEAGVESTVLVKAKLKDVTIKSPAIREFFEKYKPSQTRMEMMHVQLAQYFLDEERKFSARTDIKKGLFVRFIGLRPEFHFVSDIMVLLRLRYTHSELELVLQQMTLEGVTQVSDATDLNERHALLLSIQIRLQERRDRSRTERQAFYVSGNKRDKPKVKCFTCKEMGHYSNSCAKNKNNKK